MHAITLIKQRAEAICRLLASIDFSDGRGDRHWTLRIKSRLAQLGAEYQFETCASGLRDECEGEWLYDLVWFRNADGRLHEIGLVAESEWSTHFDYLRYDFEKLLVAISPLKLMIFQCHEGQLVDYFTRFEQGVRSFSQQLPGQTYVLAAFLIGSEELRHHFVET